jgi:hypothetical protein
MNPFPSYEGDPSSVLALATSMAEREIQEIAWRQSILAETVPMPPQPPVEVVRSIQIGAMAAMLESLENPDAVIDPVALSRALIDDEALVNVIRSVNEEPTEENMSMLRDTAEGQAKTLWEHFATDESLQQNMKRQVEAAQAVADRHSVPIHDVFDRDDLFVELITTRHTLETFVEEGVESVAKMDQDFGMAAVESMVGVILQQEINSGEISAEEAAEEKNELMLEILADETTMADLNASMAVVRQAGQRLVARGVERFWGREALDDRSTALLGRLAATGASEVPLSDTFLRLQRHNDIVATICMQNEWDPRNLTVEQTRTINASPEMQSFRGEGMDKDEY